MTRKKKIISFFAVLFVLLIVSAVLSPILIKNEKDNWNTILTDKIDFTQNLIQEVFDKYSSTVLSTSKNLKQKLSRQFISSAFNRKDLFDLFSKYDNQRLSIQLYDEEDNLAVWNSEPILGKDQFQYLHGMFGQIFFGSGKLITHLSVADSIKVQNHKFILLISIPIEKHYSLSAKNDNFKNISDSLSQKLSVAVDIDFSPFAQFSKDGRKYSFAILNNFKNKIGIASFDKPALETVVNQIKNDIWMVQSLILIIACIGLGIFGRANFNRLKKRTVKILFLIVYIILLRFILFYFEIPSSLLHNALTDSSNFSSVFGSGIVRSPLEFAITVLFLLFIVLIGYKYSTEYFFESGKQNKKLLLPVLSILFSLLIYFITLRGFGASIRSVVFDSTIRYFRDFSLFPEPPAMLMCFNILVLGCCTIILSVVLLLFIFYNIQFRSKKQIYSFLFSIFVLFQTSGWIYDAVQDEPQGTPLIRFIYIVITFILGLFIFFSKRRSILHFIYFAFAASIVSVSLLTYYNSELERESLKTTAQEITRTDQNLIEFMVHQILTQTQQDEKIIEAITNNYDLSSDAFIEWSNSMLYREGIRSAINFYDISKNYIGGFHSSNDLVGTRMQHVIEASKDSLKITKQVNLFGDRVSYFGSAPIMQDEKIAGYVCVSAIYDEDYFNFAELPKFIIPVRVGLSSAVNFDNLKIFDFHNNELVRSYSDVPLSEANEQIMINAPFNSFNEAWLNLELDNEKDLVYITKITTPEKNKILAVALEEQNFSWRLSNFFKIFFVHTIIILFLLLILLAFNIKKTIYFFRFYRTRLITAFLIVSLVPLFLVAIYFRNLTEEKNKELVEKRLTELALQIESYLQLYSASSTVNPQILFEKTASDLNISFSLYQNKDLIYSSSIIYSDVGLLPKTLNAYVFSNSILSKNQNLFMTSYFENHPVSSVYHRSQIGNETYIIQVSDLFNKVSLPLSDVELDIFLFGIFSLAVILLIIFSTLFAEQISSPIQKVTLATKSVGSGDLNVEVNYRASGEVKDLVDGFNLMVKKIKHSQSELAKVEREIAWKEMAKQVAHEIKNPLTPMKLNIQQLIAAYKDKSPKFDSIFEKVTSAIISQIEMLKNIASEFSNFARMPRLNIEKLNVVSVIRESLNLFEEEKREIKFESNRDEIFLNADRDQLKRAMVNLIRNSIQATANLISVDITTEEKNCNVRVNDNGKGIDQEDIEKIFDENFTTKEIGMGIGLTMAKKFIESISGDINVEKTSSEGTTFLITIPLAE